MEKQLSNKNYIAIADWMVRDLDLSSRELLTYAIIYGFSQDGESCFSGSLDYLAKWLNVSDRNNVRRTLNSLLAKGLIEKETIKLNDIQTRCAYRVTSSKGETKIYDHIFISPWMINTLNLKDKELILYALIYGFSRIGSDSYCQASSEYFAKWLKVQRNHVKERYLSPMIRKGYILAIEQKLENTKYQAIVPETIISDSESQSESAPAGEEGDLNAVSHFDHTFPISDINQIEVSQNDHTPSHFDHSSRPKMTTNNLDNNLVNNLDISINNNSKLNTVVYDSKDSLSVVVNERVIDSYDFSSELDRLALEAKKENDFSVYQKYCRNRNRINVASLLQKIANTEIVYILGYYPDISSISKGLDLLCKTVTNRQFKEQADQINNLTSDQVDTLFREAFRLFDPRDRNPIYRSNEAYMVGILKNILYNND